MNNRIKELMVELKKTVSTHRGDEVLIGHDEIEKFAELIVDEVYDYILNATFNDEPWPDRKDVKKHFGVEE